MEASPRKKIQARQREFPNLEAEIQKIPVQFQLEALGVPAALRKVQVQTCERRAGRWRYRDLAPLWSRKGRPATEQGPVRSASAAIFGTRENFRGSGGRTRNFRGLILARPRPNRKAAVGPNAAAGRVPLRTSRPAPSPKQEAHFPLRNCAARPLKNPPACPAAPSRPRSGRVAPDSRAQAFPHRRKRTAIFARRALRASRNAASVPGKSCSSALRRLKPASGSRAAPEQGSAETELRLFSRARPAPRPP